MNRLFIVCALLVFSCQYLSGQVFTGLWYGRAEANTSRTYNTYLCELDIKKKGNIITGNLHYYFGAYEFTTPVSGKYWPATKTIELNPFPLITYFSRQQNDADCIMDGSLTLYTHESDTTLYGQLNPIDKYRLGCPVMIISLKKERKEEDALMTETVLIKDSLPPIEPVLTASPAVISVQEQALLKRDFLQGPLIEVGSDEIEMLLYDNAEVDKDTVSVFFNRKLVVDKAMLSAQSLKIKLKLEEGENEIALYAENLGEIPPNTSLCIIMDGATRHSINLSSTLLANGTIRIRKKSSRDE